ncbi:Stk1 family PASTA domain-containing Ser/Thr kinase [Leucobacter rhizosphaerae]|uniref:non-specific serine/threonine protein kinase n=1 Tax=Leucobacter rhizosphaerae TaxID=2932245 RepID=A0ABY4FXU0_9MICO|nr:Stk1 family PASTA domain-containing Ser/Thr kinase [Leucobacter rhizosphaerae]UOQ61116.1 Stk1 family PASTA domain-containing Ser/Thr kinase [Leucobacter rhizosphaerae]
MTSAPTDPLIGQTLDGRYLIRSRIARGGMAMVYLANDLRLERRVAVKVMHEHLAEDENFTRRFEQEARSAARLAHPNLVNVFDQGHDAGRTYLVMEYLPSITLRDLLKQQQRLTLDQSLEIGEAVLSGLSAAHHAGIVHRDLKPENVMLADDGRIKLGDFGLARAVSANTTTGQALLGTIAYLSPELVTRGVADARSDLYAFGIMMYEMLTGAQPFTGEQPMQIAYQHAHSEVPVPSLVSSEATPELDELVRWTTQREPDQRPRDAGEALEYLSSIRHGALPPGATRVLPAPLPDGPSLTPSTTVLDGAQRDLLAAGSEGPQATDDLGASPVVAASAIADAASTGRRRATRGRIVAAVVVLAVLLAGGLGWWFGQGPGSQVGVPQVAGLEMDAARATLASHDLDATVVECSSLDVAAGLAVSTDPAAGERLDRGSTVELCQSTGPEMIAVPTIVGLTLDEAKRVIAAEGFTFGSVLEERFSDVEAEAVLAALGADGEALGDVYPEQGTIDLIVSAGALPDVTGLPVAEATAALEARGLVVDPALGTESHHADIPAGSVIALLPQTDPVRPGDAVGLDVSLGPELFEVPSVSGLGLQEAMDALTAAGFAPSTLVPDPLRGFAVATGTDPAAGDRVPAGTEIRVKSTISL